METKPPKYIIVEDEHGDSQWLEWPDPEEAVNISTWAAVWWLVKLAFWVIGGTLAILWIIGKVWG